MNQLPMRVLARQYNVVDDKREIVVEIANGRRLTFSMDATDPRFFDDVSEKKICAVLRPLVPEEWSMSSDTSKVL